MEGLRNRGNWSKNFRGNVGLDRSINRSKLDRNGSDLRSDRPVAWKKCENPFLVKCVAQRGAWGGKIARAPEAPAKIQETAWADSWWNLGFFCQPPTGCPAFNLIFPSFSKERSGLREKAALGTATAFSRMQEIRLIRLFLVRIKMEINFEAKVRRKFVKKNAFSQAIRVD